MIVSEQVQGQSLISSEISSKQIIWNMKINIVDIRRLDLNLAVVFLAMWQERSVTKAASKLRLARQPPVRRWHV